MKKKTGFSLIEMVAVIGLMSLALSFLLPYAFALLRTYELTMAAENVASELQAARMLAVARNEPIHIDYVDGGGNVVPPGSVPPPTSPGARLAFVSGTIRGVRVSSSSGNPLRADMGQNNIYQIPPSVSFSDVPGQPISFNSRGTLNSGGGSVLLTNATGSIAVNLSSMGRIKIADQRAAP